MTDPSLVAVYGGSFDPLHNGHVAIVDHVMRGLRPDFLHILPCHIPPHKAQLDASNAQRIAMLSLTFKGRDNIVVDERELRKPTCSYSYDSVSEIRMERGDQAVMYMVIGMDSWQAFSSWHRWEDILQLTNILIIDRPNVGSVDDQSLLRYLHQHQVSLAQKYHYTCGKVLFLDMPLHAVASSEIRQKVVAGEGISELVPSSVEKYIQDNHLYQC